jgi:hypothetical protein
LQNLNNELTAMIVFHVFSRLPIRRKRMSIIKFSS